MPRFPISDRLAAAGLAGAYGLSLGLPALLSQDGATRGMECLAVHPWVVVYPPWWANPLFFAGVASLAARGRSLPFWCGLPATLLALFTVVIIPGPHGSPVFPFGPGFFLWLGCMIGLTASAFLPESPKRGAGTERPGV